jgi:hypothetical protein
MIRPFVLSKHLIHPLHCILTSQYKVRLSVKSCWWPRPRPDLVDKYNKLAFPTAIYQLCPGVVAIGLIMVCSWHQVNGKDQIVPEPEHLVTSADHLVVEHDGIPGRIFRAVVEHGVVFVVPYNWVHEPIGTLEYYQSWNRLSHCMLDK